MDTLIEIEGLTKRFGPVVAVDDISFSVQKGEVLGFLGPNGAGKSTTMKMLTGYLQPSAGIARVCGYDVNTEPQQVKRRVGYLPEGAPSYGDMTPASFLQFVARLRRLDGADRTRRIGEVVEQMQLGAVLNRPIETLSKGFRRRVGVAQAILLDPDVLILDEPTDGLDLNQKHEVRQLLQDMAGKKAVIVSTHILEEVEAVCTRTVVIAGGRIVADARPIDLQARSEMHNAITIRMALHYGPGARAVIERHDSVRRVREEQLDGGEILLTVFPRGGREILDLVRDALSEGGVGATEIYQERGRLEDVFRQLTNPN